MTPRIPPESVRLVLDPKDFDAIVRVIENPPAPGPKLASLMRRVPAWKQSGQGDKATSG